MYNIPKFSVILPTYNRESFIVNTIQSVLEQEFKDFELLVVDDGSTDQTKAIIEKKFKSDSRLQYFFKENGERGAARNFGIKNAKGAYLVFLDSDDCMNRNYLSLFNAAIEQHTECEFFVCKYDIIDKLGTKYSPVKSLKSGFYDYKILLKGNTFACNICCKNTPALIPFKENRKYTSMEDWVFLMENLINRKLYLIEEIGLRMLDHSGRSMTNNAKVIEARLNAMEYLLQKEEYSISDLQTIRAFSYNFCAIHAYLDYKRTDSLKFFKKFQKYSSLGIKGYLIGWKYYVGRRIIERLPQSNAIWLRKKLHKDLIES